jgi:putative ABC transport system permease protein
MMLLDVSRHTVRRGWSSYVGSFVALFFGVTLIGLTVEMITAVNRYGSTVPPNDTETLAALDDLNSMLGVMSGFAGFMAIFVVASTFSFVVSSRRRELGLLRLIGCTPRQVRRMIRGESLIVAGLASLAGCMFAHLIAPLALSLAHDRGVTPMRLDAPPIWINLAIAFPIGVVVALLGARSAARRGSRIPPIDAMRESAVERRHMGFWRFTVGAIFLVGSITMLVLMGAINGELVLVLGIFAPEMLVISAICFGPWLFPALTRLIAWPLLSIADVSIRMARDNVTASAKRTASLAAPTLAISAIAGSLIVTLSVAADADHAVNIQNLKAPIVVQGGGAHTGEILQSSSSVRIADASTPLGMTIYSSDGEHDIEEAEALDVPNATAARSLHAVRGSLDDLRGHTLAMSRSYSFDSGFHLGQNVKVAFNGKKPVKLRIVAVVDDAPSLHGDLLVPAGLTAAKPDTWFVIPSAGTEHPLAGLSADLRGTSAKVESAATWIHDTDTDLRHGNTISMWVLLGPSGFYAALAIANTLLMGSLQRRREFISTLLIGATKQQLRRTVLWESALVTAAALALGTVITATVGLLIRGSLSSGLDSMPIHVPWFSLGAIGATCLTISAVAALAPTSSMLKQVHPSQAVD